MLRCCSVARVFTQTEPRHCRCGCLLSANLPCPAAPGIPRLQYRGISVGEHFGALGVSGGVLDQGRPSLQTNPQRRAGLGLGPWFFPPQTGGSAVIRNPGPPTSRAMCAQDSQVLRCTDAGVSEALLSHLPPFLCHAPTPWRLQLCRTVERYEQVALGPVNHTYAKPTARIRAQWWQRF